MDVDLSLHVAYIELIPGEILYRFIFPNLEPEDIFSLGQCWRKMRSLVEENISHPIAIRLQYIRTKNDTFYRKIVYMKHPGAALSSKARSNAVIWHVTASVFFRVMNGQF